LLPIAEKITCPAVFKKQTLNISFFFWYTIISYYLPKKRYNIIYILSWIEWYDRISYIIFLSFQKKYFYILFINNQSSKHTKRRTQIYGAEIWNWARNEKWYKNDIKSCEGQNFDIISQLYHPLKNDITISLSSKKWYNDMIVYQWYTIFQCLLKSPSKWWFARPKNHLFFITLQGYIVCGTKSIIIF
jgi:hypothetical protein